MAALMTTSAAVSVGVSRGRAFRQASSTSTQPMHDVFCTSNSVTSRVAHRRECRRRAVTVGTVVAARAGFNRWGMGFTECM